MREIENKILNWIKSATMNEDRKNMNKDRIKQQVRDRVSEFQDEDQEITHEDFEEIENNFDEIFEDLYERFLDIQKFERILSSLIQIRMNRGIYDPEVIKQQIVNDAYSENNKLSMGLRELLNLKDYDLLFNWEYATCIERENKNLGRNTARKIENSEEFSKQNRTMKEETISEKPEIEQIDQNYNNRIVIDQQPTTSLEEKRIDVQKFGRILSSLIQIRMNKGIYDPEEIKQQIVNDAYSETNKLSMGLRELLNLEDYDLLFDSQYARCIEREKQDFIPTQKSEKLQEEQRQENEEIEEEKKRQEERMKKLEENSKGLSEAVRKAQEGRMKDLQDMSEFRKVLEDHDLLFDEQSEKSTEKEKQDSMSVQIIEIKQEQQKTKDSGKLSNLAKKLKEKISPSKSRTENSQKKYNGDMMETKIVPEKEKKGKNEGAKKFEQEIKFIPVGKIKTTEIIDFKTRKKIKENGDEIWQK